MFEIIRIYPRILLRDVSETKELLQIFQSFEIPHRSLYTIVNGLKMKKDTFLRRYTAIENNLELAIWLKHPRIMFMTYFYKLVINRLTYLKHLNLANNANINTYLSNKEFFSR